MELYHVHCTALDLPSSLVQIDKDTAFNKHTRFYILATPKINIAWFVSNGLRGVCLRTTIHFCKLEVGAF